MAEGQLAFSLDADRQAPALFPFKAFGVSQMILADDPTAISLTIGYADQPPHGLEPTDVHLCCALSWARWRSTL